MYDRHRPRRSVAVATDQHQQALEEALTTWSCLPLNLFCCSWIFSRSKLASPPASVLFHFLLSSLCRCRPRCWRLCCCVVPHPRLACGHCKKLPRARRGCMWVCVCVGECVGSLQQKTARVSSHALHSAQCSFCTCHMVRCPRSRTPEHKPSGHCGACQNRFHRSSKSCPILALGTSWQSQLRHHFSSL